MQRNSAKQRTSEKETKMTKVNKIAQNIALFNRDVSANNQKKVQKCIAQSNDSKVAAMLAAQNISADDFNVALYTTEKALNAMHALTRDTFSAADIETNIACALKSLINAKNANETLTRADVYDIIMSDAKTARAHVYQRKTRIASKAQVDYTFAALRLLKVADLTAKDALRAKDCDLLALAEKHLKDCVF